MFQQCLGSFTNSPFEGSSEKGLFRHLSKHVLRSPQFLKYITYEGHIFFQNVQNLILLPKMHKKLWNRFLIS